jgi:hypothetical protein
MPGATQARYLNVNTGRFQTMDTYEGNNEEPLSLHKYLYAADNPVDNVDPSGNDIVGDFALGGMDFMSTLSSFVSAFPTTLLSGGAPNVKIIRNDGVKLGNYGVVTWDIYYGLDRPSPKGGWVIQKLKEAWDVKDSGDKPTPTGKWPNPGSQTYWEAWQVWPTTSVVLDNTDEYQNNAYPFCGKGTSGRFKWTGKVTFYEGLTLPRTFIKNNPDTGAGADQYSTTIEPRITSGSTSLNHILETHWNKPGAKGSGSSTIIDSVVPK